MASDQLERLRGLARPELPEEAWLLLSVVTDEEWDRLRELLRERARWGGGWPPREVVLGCLSAAEDG
jgi:hypothetical protein